MQKSKKTENLLYLSESYDPWFNLAVEEYLTANIKSGQHILYLWQNDDTVVIGSNQNPWKECDVSRIRKNGMKLARRQSGGGAVFHDKGNLNFTFIAENDLFDTDKHFKVIIDALKDFGMNAEFSGRNDILIGDHKISGNAYFYDEKASYHHGTILVDSDLSKLSRVLTPSKHKMKSKGVDSVKARVTNLSCFSEDIKVKAIKDSIVSSYCRHYGSLEYTNRISEDSYQSESFREIHKRYSSWEWIHGDSPNFEAIHDGHFTWGGVEIGFNLEDGLIKETRVFSDSIITGFVEKLSNSLYGIRYDSEDIKKAISRIYASEQEIKIFKDISTLMNF